MPKILMIIPPVDYRDEELLIPRQVFIENGYEVDIASTGESSATMGECTGMLGYKQQVALLVLDLFLMQSAADYDAVVLVGGMGSIEYLWENEDLHGLLESMFERDKVIAAICLSTVVLANARLLIDTRATTCPMPLSLMALEAGRAKYVESSIVDGEGTITASGPEASLDFANTIVKELSKTKV